LHFERDLKDIVKEIFLVYWKDSNVITCAFKSRAEKVGRVGRMRRTELLLLDRGPKVSVRRNQQCRSSVVVVKETPLTEGMELGLIPTSKEEPEFIPQRGDLGRGSEPPEKILAMLTAGFQQRTQVCHTLHGLDLQN
jgi:hypothetical protein